MNKLEQNNYMANLQSTIDLIEKSQALRLSYEALCKNNKNEKENINTSSLKKQNSQETLLNESLKNLDESSELINKINMNDNDNINKGISLLSNSNINQEKQINELKSLIEKQKKDNASINEQNNFLMMENERLLNGERPLRKQIKNLANYLRDIRSIREVNDTRYELVQKRFFENIEELLSTVDGSIYAFKGSFTGQNFPGLPLIKKKQIENIIDLLVGCFAHIRSAAENYPEDDILVFISLCVNICHSLSLCSCHINNLMKDINEGNDIINSLEEENIAMKSQLQSMVKMNEDLLNKYNNLEEKNKSLEENKNYIEEKYKNYMELYNEEKNKNDMKKDLIETKEKKVDKEIQTCSSDKNNNIDINMYNELNKDYKALNSKYQNSKKIIDKIQKEFRKSTKLNILLNKKLKNYNEECMKLKNSNQNEIKKNIEYKLKIKELNCKNIEITKLLNQSNDSLKLKEKEEKENVIQKENLRNESKNLKEVLKTEIKKNMKQVDSLKKKLLTYDSEVNNCRDIINKQSKDLLNLKALLISKDKTIIETQQKLYDNSKYISENIQSYNDKISNLTKENCELKEKADKIKEHKDFLEKTMIHWKKENESLRKKISKLSINAIYSKDFQRSMDEFEKKLKELSFENEKKETEHIELIDKINMLESSNKSLKDIIDKYNENEKQVQKKKSEIINLINIYKSIKSNYKDSDKSEKDSISSGSTIDVNDIGLVNDKIDDVNDILKNIIEEYHSLRSQISECQDINKSMEKNFSGMIDEKQRNIKEQIQKTKELQGKIDKLTKENNELNTILNIYNDQYIEVCRTFLLFSFSSDFKEKLFLKPGLKNHPYPFNKDIHQLCVNYQNELDNKGKIEKELKNIKIEMNDKDILLNEKLEKLNILNEKYTKCQEEYTTINDKYKSLETKSFYDNNELKRQLDELSNKNEKLESTLDVIKKGYEQMIIKAIDEE
ncbi:hypothetical protein BCR36DRAFT_586781 [Piromyces finnis]|uniref:Uncharacterized protein n=1 Tax=Piromyces finnis TaxID=1754191 RepID=A0A1Y1UYE6_9FUNG|nr:hypothetical protein BCR36DRAFT_586781 [Piromyces finnis]|eukprot:ORX43305.1 hypothetical protein BCR36DRAFT_586781 [Piromyces finnis]